MTRLSEILFVQTLRSYAAAHPDQSVGWAGFVDTQIAPALARVHESPQTDWRVSTLARAAGMSRTAFAVRFRRLMGATPVAYLARWRLIVARSALRQPTPSVAEIASRVGYQSESAFNRAFTKAFGVGPGAYRQQATRAPVGPDRSARAPGPPR